MVPISERILVVQKTEPETDHDGENRNCIFFSCDNFDLGQAFSSQSSSQSNNKFVLATDLFRLTAHCATLYLDLRAPSEHMHDPPYKTTAVPDRVRDFQSNLVSTQREDKHPSKLRHMHMAHPARCVYQPVSQHRAGNPRTNCSVKNRFRVYQSSNQQIYIQGVSCQVYDQRSRF